MENNLALNDPLIREFLAQENTKLAFGTLAMLQDEHPDAYTTIMDAFDKYRASNFIHAEFHAREGVKALVNARRTSEEKFGATVFEACNDIMSDEQIALLAERLSASAELDFLPIKLVEAHLNGGRPINGLRGIIENGPKSPSDRGTANSSLFALTL